jgi:phosphate butyryltransferase
MADRGQIKNCVVDGPLALDNAIVPYAAEHKGIKSPVAGAADIIVVPNIDVGNALSKSFSFVAGLKFGGVVAGARVPIIMSRRADSIESKLQALALSRYLMN